MVSNEPMLTYVAPKSDEHAAKPVRAALNFHTLQSTFLLPNPGLGSDLRNAVEADLNFNDLRDFLYNVVLLNYLV